MKITVSLNDSYAVNAAVQDALESAVPRSPQEAETLEKQVRKALSKWFDSNQLLAVEVDTEANTATVIRRS